MSTEETSLNRPALMYPNIHIKNKDWLKATLLCFPRVLRMHPEDFKPQDYDLVGEFMSTTNRDGKPLLGSEHINVLDKRGYSPAYAAQDMLANELEGNLDYIKRRYAPTGNRFSDGVEPYKIHTEKLEPPFYKFLLANNLAYSSQGSNYYDQTVFLHPALGDAIMTITAISVANAKGYDIVTDDTNYHLAVSALNERAVLQQLLGRLPERDASDSKAEKADELAQVVISTQFDVANLTPEQIVELNQSPDFISFKDALIPLVSREPNIDSPAVRQERYEELAQEVIKKWEATRALFSWQTAKAVAETAQISAPNFTSKLVAAGFATWISQPVGQGIFVGVLLIKSRKIYQEWREGQTAFRYLTRLEKAGALLAGGPLGAFAGNPEYGSRVPA